MDDDFLSGKVMECPAALQETELPSFQNGNSIVVLLSTGKKYLGVIGRFSYVVKNGIATGTFELQRKIR